VRLEASNKPHVHNLIHEFLINMAFTMACPNFKKGLKMVSGPLGARKPLKVAYVLPCDAESGLWYSKLLNLSAREYNVTLKVISYTKQKHPKT
jgi:hypothetical protein